MESEDSRLHGGTESSVAAKLPHHFANARPPDPNLLHARDSNAELQRAQPEWHGPFLAEGECYKTPRTEGNVVAGCKAAGLDELSAEGAGERQFFADLIRKLWVLSASGLTPMTAPTASGVAGHVSHAGARGGNQPMGNEQDGGDASSSRAGGGVGVGSGSAVDASGDGVSTAGATRGGAVGCLRGGGSGARGCGGGGATCDGGCEWSGPHVLPARPLTRSRGGPCAYALAAGGVVKAPGGERVDRLIAPGVVLAVVVVIVCLDLAGTINTVISD